MNEREIFIEALQKTDAAARQAYLHQACGDDAALRQRIEELLKVFEQAGSFLEAPPAAPGTTSDPSEPAALSEGPGSRIGPYKLLQKLGEGGMGVVFMAEQQEPVRRMVALKIVKPGMDSAVVLARFEAERQALALMDHHNIARIFDGGVTDSPLAPPGGEGSGVRGSGRPYFVMELVKGLPITRFCDENRLTPRERLELFVPVCQAVQHAHQKGVIHRDIKPSNVLVTLYDGTPVPKVIDFGVAKALHQKLTERTLFTAFGAAVGTLEYMSPEQAELNALDVDTRSDVYSLGVLLYELLTGTTPLQHERMKQAAYVEILRLIREEEPPRPSNRLSGSGAALARISAQRKMEPAQLARLLRGELDWIVMKALEKERGRRYETAIGLARDVEHYLKDEPVEACPPTLGYRLRKFGRKYRVALSTATAFAALLVIAAVVSTWLAIVAKNAENTANEKREIADQKQQEADDERNRANREAGQAKANAAATGRALDRTTVAKGIELAGQGKIFAALPQFIKPLERGGLSPEEEKIHRMRIACYLRYTPGRPRLRHVLFCDKPLSRRVWPSPTMTFSADGKRLLAVAEDVVHLWDLHRGNLLPTLKHLNRVRTAQFSRDDTRVLTVSGEATVWRWDAASGRRLDPPVVDWGGLLQRPTALLPTSPWQFIASAGAKPWEYSGWMDPYRFVGETEISRDGRRALFTFAKTTRLLDLQTHKLVGQGFYPDSRAWSPDFRFFLQADGNLVKIRDTTDGKRASQSFDHGSPVRDTEFSSDGNRVLTVGKDGFVRVWDVRTRQPCGSIRLTTELELIRDRYCLSPDNRLLAGWDGWFGVLAWWDVETGKLIRKFPQKRGLYEDQYIDWRADGKQLLWVFPPTPNVVTLLDAASNWEPGLVLPQRGVVEAVYSPDGRTLATGGREGVIRIWDLCAQDDAVKWQAPEIKDMNTDIRLRQDYSRFTWRWDEKRTVEVKTVTGSQKLSWLAPQQSLPPGTSFSVGTISPDQGRAITCHLDPHYPSHRILKLWDTNARRIVGKPLELTVADPPKSGLPSFCTCVAFSPDSRLFVVASDTVVRETPWTAHGKAQLYEARTGNVVGKPLKHEGPVFFTAFSPDGELLVTCCGDATARLWRTKTGQPATASLRHGDMVTCAAFAPNGKILATGSRDGTVRFWDAASGMLAGGLTVNKGTPWNLAFHPSEQLILVCYTDQKDPNDSPARKIQIFDISSYQEVGPAVKEQDWPDRHQFRLRKDGRFAFGLFDRRTWNLTPDNRSVGDLVKLAQLYSGQRLGAKGSAFSLTKQELQTLWRELSAKYPEEFAVSPKSAVEWRIEQLRSSSKEGRRFEIAFQRRWLAAELIELGWQPGERGNEDMERDNYLHRLYALALHGRHAEAITAADALAARWSKDNDTLYKCACVHALAAGAVSGDAALAARYAARSVALLRQAIEAGYKDSEKLRKDPDLDALRRREDFRELLRTSNQMNRQDTKDAKDKRDEK